APRSARGARDPLRAGSRRGPPRRGEGPSRRRGAVAAQTRDREPAPGPEAPRLRARLADRGPLLPRPLGRLAHGPVDRPGRRRVPPRRLLGPPRLRALAAPRVAPGRRPLTRHAHRLRRALDRLAAHRERDVRAQPPPRAARGGSGKFLLRLPEAGPRA